MSELSDLALEYRHLDEVSSTNDYLRTYTPSADITVVSASFQTKGRGQMGNTWISDAGENALFSIQVYPKNLKASDGFVLSQAMALSIKEVLDGYLDGISIKWPNDIYCGSEKIGSRGIRTCRSIELDATPPEKTTGKPGYSSRAFFVAW